MPRLLTGLLRIPLLAAAVSTGVFLLLELAPGDSITELRLAPGMTPEALQRHAADHGLNQPLWRRYSAWAYSMLTGEFGYSTSHGAPIRAVLLARVGATLGICLPALALAGFGALFLGSLQVAGQGASRAVSALALLLAAVPDVVLALAAVVCAPALGAEAPAPWPAVLAVAVLCLPYPLGHAANAFRVGRESAYVTHAIAQGMRGVPLIRWMMPAVLAELSALAGPAMASALGASAVVETVFAWPGLGTLLVEAVLARDTQLVVSATLFATLLVAVAGLAGDVALGWIDRRVVWT